MRAQLTYWTVSPRTPQRVAQATSQLLALASAVAGLVAVLSGTATHVLFSGVVLAAQTLGGAA